MKNLFVGNMSFQTTEADLRALFEPFGQITRIHIVNDRETGQPRGFAFVEMAKDDEAAKAMSELNGKEVAGRALRVNEATPKPERGGPRGSFGPRGGGGRGSGGSRGRGGYSTEDYRDSARQPREPRW
ncbi:MAG: RNA-binding protein [Acidobacteria bacterium]|jgi:cold-inducible RNA-binding protein|nr:MAG: RNA-binding protein [Acidobacteriota bacterium]